MKWAASFNTGTITDSLAPAASPTTLTPFPTRPRPSRIVTANRPNGGVREAQNDRSLALNDVRAPAPGPLALTLG
jgi:hypothetical protein